MEKKKKNTYRKKKKEKNSINVRKTDGTATINMKLVRKEKKKTKPTQIRIVDVHSIIRES